MRSLLFIALPSLFLVCCDSSQQNCEFGYDELIPGCLPEPIVKRCHFGYCNEIRDCCPGTVGSDTVGSDTVGSDTVGSDTVGSDTVESDTQADSASGGRATSDGQAEEPANEDAVSVGEDADVVGQCNSGDPQALRIGMPCSSHSQCGSCYCYDEAYMAPFRFCTVDCSSGTGAACSDWDTPNSDKPEYVCVRFTQQLIETYDLGTASVCMPRCQDAADCAIYTAEYKHCGSVWDGQHVQGLGTCQTSAQ
jgi:hypothetical protein